MRRAVLALCASLAPLAAAAQSSPNWTYGYVPTAGQWNVWFANKQDVLGFHPLNVSGGTMSGKLGFALSTSAYASFGLPIGVAPSSPNQGDVWSTSSGIYVYFNGAVHQIFPAALADVTGLGAGVATALALAPNVNGGFLTTGGIATGALIKSQGASPAVAAVASVDYAPATSGTAILKGNGTGAFASAVAGTDYAPATSGSAILKGNGAGGFSSAVSGTDYAPATSGSTVLKGNGAGGFSSAVAGTDYVAPGVALAAGQALTISQSLAVNTAPTIASGGGTSPSITASNGSAAFRVNVGTGGSASSITLTMPTAGGGFWNCSATDITTVSSTVFTTRAVSTTATALTLTNYNNTGAAAAWASGDIVAVMCSGD